MSAAPILLPSSWENLVETWRGLDVPEGWRAEIIEENIVMSPPPGLPHNLIASCVHRALVHGTPHDWEIFQTAGVSVPMRSGLFVPGLVVVPRGRIDRALPEDDPDPIPMERALLAVEITSKSNADTDRKTKLWGYAHAEVPLYLLVDRFAAGEPTVSLYSEPADGRYRHLLSVPFGEKITLPEPFELTLDTAEF